MKDEDTLKALVKEIRLITKKFGSTDIAVDLDSKNVEHVIYYHSVIKKLTGVDLHFVLK